MSVMFEAAEAFNQPIGNWDTSKVTNMSSMFRIATVFDQDIGNWDTSKVTAMGHMFYYAEAFNQDISKWETANAIYMHNMFASASAFNQDISQWNTTQVIDMDEMFRSASAFNQDISGWDTASVTDMSSMFREASVFNKDISSWDTSNVTDMSYMFLYADVFNQPIGSWDTSKVMVMNHMFYQAKAFDQDIGDWDVAALTDASSMFTGVKLSTVNYDALLIGWDAQELLSNVALNAGLSKYCSGEYARMHMISADNWQISDGGRECILPEIELSGLGVIIQNGDIDPSTSDGTDFESMAPGGTPITRTFTITNLGVDALNLTGTPTVMLDAGTHFTVTHQPITTTVLFGSPETVELTFDAQATGIFTDTVTIESNDIDENPYSFVINPYSCTQRNLRFCLDCDGEVY
jgi:surface protein